MTLMETTAKVKQYCFERRFFIMLLLLMALLFFLPLSLYFLKLVYLFDLLTLIVFISGINAISAKRSHTLFGIMMTFLFLGLTGERYLAHIIPSDFLAIKLVGVIYILFLIIIILKFIYNTKEVTRDIIYGSIVVYLLIGFAVHHAARRAN